MKFLCIGCDAVMSFSERALPGDGTMAAVFRCPTCDREVAMLTNPMETQLVSGLGIKVGGRTVPAQPMELTRGSIEGGRADAFDDEHALRDTDPGNRSGAPFGSGEPSAESVSQPTGRVVWSVDATDRLGRVPSFVRGMVKRIYADYARERGIAEITPAMMDRARTELGLEDM